MGFGIAPHAAMRLSIRSSSVASSAPSRFQCLRPRLSSERLIVPLWSTSSVLNASLVRVKVVGRVRVRVRAS